MGFLEEHIIPGAHGKTFTVDFQNQYEFEKIEPDLAAIPGIRSVSFDQNVQPHEIIVYASDVVDQRQVQEVVQSYGYHALPKKLFAIGN